jgi:PIN domain nuclease of toxin-antitoxin system
VILLDTHALAWMDSDDRALGPLARRALQEAWNLKRLAASAVSFWECAMLHARRRLVLPQSPRAWRSELLAAGLIELPIDGEIAVLATELDDLHKDPADRFIAATAIKHQATLLTADARLLRWRHPLERRDATK